MPVAALLDVLRVWRGSRSGVTSGQALLPFWGVVLIGAIGVGTLSVLLRTPTLGGATSEIREFLRPGLDLRGLQTSLRILGGWHPLLLPVMLLAVPISRAGWRSLLTGGNVAPALLMLLAVIAFNSFGLVRRGEARYLLPALPFLSIVAAAAVDRVGTYLGGTLSRRSSAVNWQTAVPSALLLTLVVTSLDPGRLRADAETRTVNTTWVQAMAERAPDDLIVSFAPTLTSRYLGRTDIWLRTEGYAKYVWKGRPPYRDVHTGAIVVRNESELDRLLVCPNRGRTAWVLLAGEPSAESDRTTRELAKELVSMATTTRRTEDGRVVLRIRL